MDKIYFEKLKKIDSREVAFGLANSLQEIGCADNLHAKSVCVAYILYADKKDSTDDEIETFFEKSTLSEEIKDILNRNVYNLWEVVRGNVGKYTDDQLLAFILFDNSVEDYKSQNFSTPLGLSKLACRILDIKDFDNVLELCSGIGGFAVEAYGYNQTAQYSGVELNYVAREVSVLRLSLLGSEGRIELRDAFEYKSEYKADKLFSNYPFILRSPSLKKYREKMQTAFGVSKEVVQRASSDWLFNAALIEQMKDDGKAVAIMTNGSAWGNVDKNIRQFFIENGYIEAVISLPNGIFNVTAIPTTMIVFSRNNKKIRMVDARNICTRVRRNNVLNDQNIEEIVSLLHKDTEVSIEKDLDDFANNEYVLNAVRYLEVIPEFENGVEFERIITNITRGSQLKASEFDEMKSDSPTKYQYLKLANINNGVISLEGCEQYLSHIPDKLEKYCIKNNSIVLSRHGMPAFKSAVAQIDDDNKILADGNIFIIELDETKANPFYIQAFFASEVGTAIFRSICTGTVISNILFDKLKKMVVPLPSMEEQNEIGKKYAAAMDEMILLRRRLKKVTNRMKHIYDEEV